MPYVSDKQRRYMNAAAARGEIDQDTVDEWNEKSRGKKLPESAPKKKGAKGNGGGLVAWAKRKAAG